MHESCTDWSWIDVVDICISTLFISIGVYVIISGVRGMWKNKNIKIFFKVSYFAVIASYFIAFIGSFIDTSFFHDIVFVGYYIMFIVLIAILITRFLFLFRDTSYALHHSLTVIFYTISVLSALTACIDLSIAISLQIYYVLIHLITSCVIFFVLVHKLNIFALHDVINKGLKIEHANKYITLLLIIFSSAFVLIVTDVTIYLIDECILYRIYILHLLKLGLIVNIWCFYLQFSFSQTEYQKCCLCLDNIINRSVVHLEQNAKEKEKKLTINVSHTPAVKRELNLSPNSAIHHTAAPTPTLLSVLSSNEIMHVSLDRISFNGKIIGKRGADKPKRYKNDKMKLSTNIPALAEDETDMKQRPLGKHHIFNTPSPTVMSTYRTAHISQESLLTPCTQPVNTLVFEFGDVMCTQIDKLKSHAESGVVDITREELYFGGSERLIMLREWLGEIHKSGNLLCCIITDCGTEMVTALLQHVELLIYFVSLHPDDDDKWVSNVIGYDHIIANKVSSERHLILLKLIQSLGINHNHLLYIGSNKDIVGHIDNIYLCETYHVQTKGLVKRDLDQIKRKYFVAQYAE